MIIKNRNTVTGSSYGESGLGMLEWFCIIVLPIGHAVSIYFIMSSITDFIWWVNLIITFVIWSVLLVLIYLLSWWMAENDILR